MKFSTSLIIPLVTLLLAYACSSPTEVTVSHSGALKEIMSGNIKGTISLRSLKHTKNLYALGALEDLQGEIQVFNGEVMVSSVEGGVLANSNSWEHQAALLVYTSVRHWTEVDIPNDVVNQQDLEAFVKKAAVAEGIPANKPFPFLVEGGVKNVDYHIIKWNMLDTVHTHAKHQNSGIKDRLIDVPVTMLGFYSENHKGIFTHHSTNLHMHFRTEDELSGLAGHVDGFILGEKMTLKLPKQL